MIDTLLEKTVAEIESIKVPVEKKATIINFADNYQGSIFYNMLDREQPYNTPA